MRQIPLLIIAAFVGVGALGGFLAAFFFVQGDTPGTQMQNAESASHDRRIAYWVAPMDPNFRRSEPGLSPMGMELVPVYDDQATGAEDGEPALQINPAVVNNIGVRTEVVRRSDLALDIRTVGHVMADEEKISDVHVRTEGWIEQLAVEAEGEAVERGDLLFQIYSPTLVAAQSEYLQAVRLGRPSLLSGATERLAALGMSQGQISRLRESGTVNRLTAIYAPQSGVVTALKVREGMFIRPSDNTMSLADLSTVWVLADVFETQADWVAVGQRALMTLSAFPGESWVGEVDYVYPTAQSRARTISVRLRVSNPSLRLKPNMYADIAIEAAPKAGVLVIPQAALIRSSQGDRVILALGDGRFRPAQVRAGIESGDHIEILEGLEENERVVISSQFLIDSEASFDATLLRLTAADAGSDAMQTAAAEGGANMSGMDMGNGNLPAQEADSTSAVGTVQSVDPASRSIVLTHEPIPELNWPSMTMGFSAADDLPLESIEEGADVRFEFRQIDNGFEIFSLVPLVPEAAGGGGP